MLRIKVVLQENFDETNNQFDEDTTFDLDLEHSLVSLSKWESHFEKAFLSSDDKSQEEMLWYVHAMVVTPEVPPEVFSRVHNNFDEIAKYIDSRQTATRLPEGKKNFVRSITAEQIYYWMIAYQIPFECQYWHLNRLLTLIRVCNEKNSPQQKMSRNELANKYKDLNARRRAELNSKG